MDANFLFEYFCNPINQPDKELQPKKYAAAQLFLSWEVLLNIQRHCLQI